MIRIRDIAEKAGVSHATVSVVLNRRQGTVRVSSATRQRVLAVADAMGYRPNDLARAMVTGKRRVLGFLASHPDAEFRARMLTGAVDAAEAAGYFVKIVRLVDKSINREMIHRCVEQRFAGVLAIHLFDGALEYLHAEMARYEVPLVVLDSSFPHPWGTRILTDDMAGCREAVAHLAKQGHRRIAMVSGDPAAPGAVLREEGFRRALQDLQLPLPDELVVHGFWDVAQTERVTERLLRHVRERPTAIFCASDGMAMVVMRTARLLGFPVPGALSVIGFANLSVAELADPPLTTVAQPFEEMGRRAVQYLLDGSAAAVENGETLLLPTRLVVRASCGPAANFARP